MGWSSSSGQPTCCVSRVDFQQRQTAGPGVCIVSSVPKRHELVTSRAALPGTSMADPAVCGALAVLLARDSDYLSLPRDATRATKARPILRKACREIGFNDEFEGMACRRSSERDGGLRRYDSGAMVRRSGTYVLAVAREMREAVRADWQARVNELGGSSAGPPASPYRKQIEADTAAMERIRGEFGSLLRIEARVLRRPTG